MVRYVLIWSWEDYYTYEDSREYETLAELAEGYKTHVCGNSGIELVGAYKVSEELTEKGLQAMVSHIEAQEKITLMQQALAKLTPEEREALGL